MRGLLVRARDVVRHGLVRQTALDVLTRAGLEITPFRLYEESLESVPATARRPPPELEIRPLVPDDAPALARMPETDVGEAEARHRLMHGVVGIGAWSGDEVVACSWANLDVLDFDPLRRPLEPDEAYLFGARTLRTHRGLGLGPTVRVALQELAAARGRTRFLSVSYTLHQPANRFKKKLGARVRARYVHVKLLGRWGWTWRTGGESQS